MARAPAPPVKKTVPLPGSRIMKRQVSYVLAGVLGLSICLGVALISASMRQEAPSGGSASLQPPTSDSDSSQGHLQQLTPAPGAGLGESAPPRTAAANAPLAVAAQPGASPAVLAEFTSWADRYVGAAPERRGDLEAEGVRLAAARRPAFRKLIQSDPRRAIEQASRHSRFARRTPPRGRPSTCARSN